MLRQFQDPGKGLPDSGKTPETGFFLRKSGKNTVLNILDHHLPGLGSVLKFWTDYLLSCISPKSSWEFPNVRSKSYNCF